MFTFSKRMSILLGAAAISLAAMAQTDFVKSSGETYYVGYGPNGNVSFVSVGKANHDKPSPSTPGLKAVDEALFAITGMKVDNNGNVIFNYLPGDNFKQVSAAEFKEALATKPQSASRVESSISKFAETPNYLTLRATSYTKSLNPDAYDFGTVEFVNYNKKTDAIIDYFDVFNASAERRLREMIYPLAAKKYRLTVKSPDEIEIMQNFGLSPQGVTFVFPESTIAPGNAGIPEILLTWDQLRRAGTLADGVNAIIGN